MQEQPKIYCICYGQGVAGVQNGKSDWFSERLRRPLVNLYSGLGCPRASNQDRDMPHSGLRPRIEVKEKVSSDETPDSPRSLPVNDLTYTCFCFDCKTKVTTPNYVVYCPNKNCRSKWVRTEYICGDCGRKDMIYDAIYKFWFFDRK
jgi:hypothetical protein